MEDEVCDAAGCSNCDQVVHHFCSNEIYDGELSVRACSDSCAEVLRASIGAVPVDAIGDREISNHASAASSASAARDDPPAKVSAEGKKRKKKFFFTTAADLALLKETLNLRQFAAVHGTKGKIYTAIAEKLGKKFDTKLSERTKSGPAEDYDEYKQLLTDISMQMYGIKEDKVVKKAAEKGKAARLHSQGEVLREKATKLRCQWRSLETNDSAKPGAGADQPDTPSAGQTADQETVSDTAVVAITASCITTATSGSGGGSTRGSSAKSANAELAEYLGFHMEIREQEKVRQVLVIEIKKVKLNKEERRWAEDMAFRKAHAEAKEIKWAQELAMRRDEAAIRRLELEVRKEELALLRHQM
ncbi:hypothetical protein PHYPSEUDO_003140 [Phytophthora pseudosyringae]|uniref:Uncharacterized protein n=1 Tax=Phytophthora pseudosyringae TaxID=221518 RepID=A0A8T1WHW4_9STRA|nr:hypothetical protein PHYPSEUDO_003140 [Phytophthora pseudosyringae]